MTQGEIALRPASDKRIPAVYSLFPFRLYVSVIRLRVYDVCLWISMSFWIVSQKKYNNDVARSDGN